MISATSLTSPGPQQLQMQLTSPLLKGHRSNDCTPPGDNFNNNSRMKDSNSNSKFLVPSLPVSSTLRGSAGGQRSILNGTSGDHHYQQQQQHHQHHQQYHNGQVNGQQQQHRRHSYDLSNSPSRNLKEYSSNSNSNGGAEYHLQRSSSGSSIPCSSPLPGNSPKSGSPIISSGNFSPQLPPPPIPLPGLTTAALAGAASRLYGYGFPHLNPSINPSALLNAAAAMNYPLSAVFGNGGPTYSHNYHNNLNLNPADNAFHHSNHILLGQPQQQQQQRSPCISPATSPYNNGSSTVTTSLHSKIIDVSDRYSTSHAHLPLQKNSQFSHSSHINSPMSNGHQHHQQNQQHHHQHHNPNSKGSNLNKQLNNSSRNNSSPDLVNFNHLQQHQHQQHQRKIHHPHGTDQILKREYNGNGGEVSIKSGNNNSLIYSRPRGDASASLELICSENSNDQKLIQSQSGGKEGSLKHRILTRSPTGNGQNEHEHELNGQPINYSSSSSPEKSPNNLQNGHGHGHQQFNGDHNHNHNNSNSSLLKRKSENMIDNNRDFNQNQYPIFPHQHLQNNNSSYLPDHISPKKRSSGSQWNFVTPSTPPSISNKKEFILPSLPPPSSSPSLLADLQNQHQHQQNQNFNHQINQQQSKYLNINHNNQNQTANGPSIINTNSNSNSSNKNMNNKKRYDPPPPLQLHNHNPGHINVNQLYPPPTNSYFNGKSSLLKSPKTPKTPKTPGGSRKMTTFQLPPTNSNGHSTSPSLIRVEQMPLIEAFRRGSLIRLGSGELKAVEDLNVEDFITAAASMCESTRIIHCTVMAIDLLESNCKVTLQINGSGGSQISNSNHQNNKAQVCELILSNPELPFFILGRGWSSCSPKTTEKLFQLQCSPLAVGDICISLTRVIKPSKPSVIRIPGKVGRPCKYPAGPKTPTKPSIKKQLLQQQQTKLSTIGIVGKGPESNNSSTLMSISSENKISMGPPPSPSVLNKRSSPTLTTSTTISPITKAENTPSSPESPRLVICDDNIEDIKDRPSSPKKRRWSCPAEVLDKESSKESNNLSNNFKMSSPTATNSTTTAVIEKAEIENENEKKLEDKGNTNSSAEEIEISN